MKSHCIIVNRIFKYITISKIMVTLQTVLKIFRRNMIDIFFIFTIKFIIKIDSEMNRLFLIKRRGDPAPHEKRSCRVRPEKRLQDPYAEAF